jgi:hypothetical protein
MLYAIDTKILIYEILMQKKALISVSREGFKKRSGDNLLSHKKLTLSSARNVFTSEFGMGSGGTRMLWSPES